MFHWLFKMKKGIASTFFIQKKPSLQNAASDSSDHEHIFHVITQLHIVISCYQNTLHKTPWVFGKRLQIIKYSQVCYNCAIPWLPSFVTKSLRKCQNKIMLLDCWKLLGSPFLSSKQYEIYKAKSKNMHKYLILRWNYRTITIISYQNPTH